MCVSAWLLVTKYPVKLYQDPDLGMIAVPRVELLLHAVLAQVGLLRHSLPQ